MLDPLGALPNFVTEVRASRLLPSSRILRAKTDRAPELAPIIGLARYHRDMPIVPYASRKTGQEPAVALFHSLSDAARLAIIRRLGKGEARVVDLVIELGLAQSTVSGHLTCLRDCELVIGRPEGRQVFYSLVRPELLDLLVAAEKLLLATGHAVSLCPNYGQHRVKRARRTRGHNRHL